MFNVSGQLKRQGAIGSTHTIVFVKGRTTRQDDRHGQQKRKSRRPFSGQSARQQQREQQQQNQNGQQGENQPTRLAELQKQIVIATWKLRQTKTVEPKENKP